MRETSFENRIRFRVNEGSSRFRLTHLDPADKDHPGQNQHRSGHSKVNLIDGKTDRIHSTNKYSR